MRGMIDVSDEQIEVVTRLYHLLRARRLPPVYIDRGRIEMETVPGCRRRVSWIQARRLAAGEPVDDVFAPRAACRPRRDDWRIRRAEYLRATGRRA